MSDDSIFSKWAPVVVYSLTPDRASWKANHDEAWGALQTTADKVIVHFEHTVKPIEVQLTAAHEWLAAGAKFCTLSDGADSNFGFYFEESAQAAQCTAAVTRQLRSLRTGKITSSQRAAGSTTGSAGLADGVALKFGISLLASDLAPTEKYGRIPLVLLALEADLRRLNAFKTEGIFRLAPDKHKCDETKRLLEAGSYRGTSDVNVLANLVKVWLRELPEPLLNCLPEATLVNTAQNATANVATAVAAMPDLPRRVFLWLLDLLIDVTAQEAENKMPPRNLAIVFAPNLYNSQSVNPMTAMTLAQHAVRFLTKALEWRRSSNTK